MRLSARAVCLLVATLSATACEPLPEFNLSQGSNNGSLLDTGVSVDVEGESEIAPVAGRWLNDSLEVAETTCPELMQFLPFDNEALFFLTDVSTASFHMEVATLNAGAGCELGDKEAFACYPMADAVMIDGLGLALPTRLDATGELLDESHAVGKHSMVMACDGDACEAVEELYQLRFPCHVTLEWSAVHEDA